jgi:hypothetical protein
MNKASKLKENLHSQKKLRFSNLFLARKEERFNGCVFMCKISSSNLSRKIYGKPLYDPKLY